MSTLNEKLDKTYGNLKKLIDKNMPKGDNAQRSNLWLGSCLATVAGGLYTAMIDWNPIVRTAAHFTGALAMPAAGAFVSSLAISGIEKATNFGIHLYNKKHPGKEKEDFKINPKTKNIIKLISTATVGIAYAYGTLGYEMDGFANTGIFQADQYLADILGSLGGIAAFNKLEPKEVLASFMNKVTTLSEAIVKPINTLEEKLTHKNKENNIETNFDMAKESISKEDISQKTYNSLDESLKKHVTWFRDKTTKTPVLTPNKPKVFTKNKTQTHDNNMEI